MTNTKIEIGLHEWSVLNDNAFLADVSTGTPIVVSCAELEELHPQFPIALRASIARNEMVEPPKSSASGAEAYYTLLLLRNDPIRLVDSNGNTVDYVSILTLKLDPGLPRSATLFGIAVDIDTVEHNGQVVPFVTCWNGMQSCVLKDALDKQFPGWENRVRAGEELGLTGADLCSYSLTQVATEPGLNTNMSELAFD